MSKKTWTDELAEHLEQQAEKATYVTRLVHRTVPISVIIGALMAFLLVKYWGWREFFRAMIQVVLVLTLGATVFASVLKRLNRVLEDDEEEKKR